MPVLHFANHFGIFFQNFFNIFCFFAEILIFPGRLRPGKLPYRRTSRLDGDRTETGIEGSGSLFNSDLDRFSTGAQGDPAAAGSIELVLFAFAAVNRANEVGGFNCVAPDHQLASRSRAGEFHVEEAVGEHGIARPAEGITVFDRRMSGVHIAGDAPFVGHTAAEDAVIRILAELFAGLVFSLIFSFENFTDDVGRLEINFIDRLFAPEKSLFQTVDKDRLVDDLFFEREISDLLQVFPDALGNFVNSIRRN